MARWTWTTATAAGAEQAELTAATSRAVTWRLNAGATASFTIDGRHELANEISELATDLVIRRDGDKIFRGRVGATSDSLDADRHELTVEVADYRALLGRRIWHNAQTDYVSVDQGTIAWALITHTQGQTGGDLGITQGLGATSVVSLRRVEPGANIAAELDALAIADWPLAAGSHAGFDWTINPDLELDIHYPTRGQSRPDVVLEYGGAIESVQRNLDPGNYANAVRLNGATGVTPATRTSADIASRAEGRWDKQIGDSSITTDADAGTRADRWLVEYETLEATYTATLRPDWWTGPDHLWIGDEAPVRIQSGRLDEVATLRVTEMSVALNENGDETVAVTFGPSRSSLREVLRLADRRLTHAERA